MIIKILQPEFCSWVNCLERFSHLFDSRTFVQAGSFAVNVMTESECSNQQQNRSAESLNRNRQEEIIL